MLHLDVLYEQRLDATAWSERHLEGEVPDRWPYGLDRLASAELTVQARKPTPPLTGVAGKIEHRLAHHWRHGLRRSPADAVISWDERAGVPAILAGRQPVVTGVIWATDQPDRLTTAALRRAAAVWTSSSAQVPILHELGVRGARHIPLGIDADFFSAQTPSDEARVVSAGNDRHRDFDTLVAAFGNVRRGTASLHIYTGRPIRPQALIQAPGRISHVALRREYQRSAFVAIPLSPNVHVSGATALLEAMASARAVVVTDNPGISEYVEHGVTGLLVPPGDAEAMAEAMETLLADPELAVAMGRAGRLAVERRFTTSHQAHALRDFVLSVL